MDNLFEKQICNFDSSNFLVTWDKMSHLSRLKNDISNEIVFLFFRQQKIFDEIYSDSGLRFIGEKKVLKFSI